MSGDGRSATATGLLGGCVCGREALEFGEEVKVKVRHGSVSKLMYCGVSRRPKATNKYDPNSLDTANPAWTWGSNSGKMIRRSVEATGSGLQDWQNGDTLTFSLSLPGTLRVIHQHSGGPTESSMEGIVGPVFFFAKIAPLGGRVQFV